MGPRWTEAEDSVVRDMWSRFTTEEISEELPRRTIRAVYHRARALGLRKTPQDAGRTGTLRWERDLAERLGEPVCEWLRRRYSDEATYRELTAEAGINTRSLMRLMKKCDVEPISPSEAAKRLIRDRPEIIDNLVAAAHTPQAARKRAQSRHENWESLQTDQERAFLDALHEAGLSPVCEYPVARYNIDFAFISSKLAVELDPLWHRSGRKAEADAKKDAILEARGWTVLRLESRCTTSFNISKIESALNELARTQPPGVNT